MHGAERARFDALVEEVIEDLPEALRELIEECPVVAEDRPSAKLLRELAKEFGEESIEPDELCGLHTGVAFTERSVEHAELSSEIMLFREGIVAQAGGWARGDDAVYDEIRITLLHEIGHQFGLDEDDLERLGYQ
jgi:predicted Zn-dependent protease with MMP-like domain